MRLLRKYDNAAAANVARSLLASCGLETYLAEPPVVLKAGSFRLIIADELFDEATAILDEHQQSVALPDDFVPPKGDANQEQESPGDAEVI